MLLLLTQRVQKPFFVGISYSRILNKRNNLTMNYKKYRCLLCGFVYDEEKGWPDDGLAPGTRWEDVPEFWFCPDCGAMKSEFVMVEI